MAVNPIEVRLAHLEGAFEQINHRLGAIEGRLDSIDSRMESRFAAVDARLERLEDRLVSRMDRQFYWILTLVVLSILVPISLRVLNL
ncbi:MAG: hypothetical protein ACRDF5_01615 [bacterium]